MNQVLAVEEQVRSASPSRIVVEVSASEMVEIASVGARRRIMAIKKGRTEPYGTPEQDLWRNDIESSGAEYVVAKVTGLFWRSEILKDLADKPPDVGDCVEVRWTPHPTGHLPVYSRDYDDRPYFLVVGEMPCYIVCGWLFGADAKNEEWARVTPRGTNAYWVPQEGLRPVGEFVVTTPRYEQEIAG